MGKEIGCLRHVENALYCTAGAGLFYGSLVIGLENLSDEQISALGIASAMYLPYIAVRRSPEIVDNIKHIVNHLSRNS